MENNDFNTVAENHQKWQNNKRKVLGAILIIGGTLIAFDKAGFYIPSWVFSIGTFFITLGILGAIKNNFKVGGWIILMAIGSLFLLDRFFHLDPELLKFKWPAFIVLLGFILIFKSKSTFSGKRFRSTMFPPKGFANNEEFDAENRIDAMSVFGGVNKTIISKNFQGGEITAIFGGCDVNLSQADFDGKITIDITAIMGGVKLIVPQDWQLIIEANALFGAVEDKRAAHQGVPANKILVIKGLALFGGIQISPF